MKTRKIPLKALIIICICYTYINTSAKIIQKQSGAVKKTWLKVQKHLLVLKNIHVH